MSYFPQKILTVKLVKYITNYNFSNTLFSEEKSIIIFIIIKNFNQYKIRIKNKCIKTYSPVPVSLEDSSSVFAETLKQIKF